MPDDLKTIVQRMIDAGESEENIGTVIQHFKQKAALPTRPVSAEDFAPEGSGESLIPKGASLGNALIEAAKSIPSSIAGAVKTAYTDQRPEDAALGPARVLAPLIRSIGAAHLATAKRAIDEARAGHVSEALGHGAAALLPAIGPATAQAGEDIGSGEPARMERGGGQALVLTGSMIAPAAVGGVARGGKAVARNFYLRSLKPTKAVLEDAPAFKTGGGQAGARAEMAQTGLENRVPVGGARGVAKIEGLIENVNQKIADRIAQADLAGRIIDPIQVAKRAQDIKARFANQVTPQSDLAAIDQAIADFMAHPSFGTKGGAASLLSPTEAQAMKQGTYRTLKSKAYGETGTASTEAQKGLARGLKEEIASEVPEVGPLNRQESQLINLEKALQDRARTAGNADPFKLGEQVLMAGVRPKTALLGLINRPGILSRGAIGLNDLSTATGRLAAPFRAALLAMLGQGDQP